MCSARTHTYSRNSMHTAPAMGLKQYSGMSRKPSERYMAIAVSIREGTVSRRIAW
jgi:hypothetical protein